MNESADEPYVIHSTVRTGVLDRTVAVLMKWKVHTEHDMYDENDA